MVRFHDCKRSGCVVKPDGTEWLTDAKGRPIYDELVVFDNDAGEMVSREAAKARQPKVD